MQKKKNTRFKVIDLAIILLCITGSAASGRAFWLQYTRTLTRLHEEPVGTIVFKKRTAQRKFIDRVVWDNLKQASEIYNGDTIRTIQLSEAEITFRNDITQLTMNENTMVQIFYNDIDGARIDFSGGNLAVASGSGSVVVTSGSNEIKIDGFVNINKNEEGFSLSVLEGEAVFDGEKIESGAIIALDEKGGIDVKPVIAMTSFGSSVQILGAQSEATSVNFAWNTSNFNDDTFVIIEVALDASFNYVVASRETRGVNAASVTVENGNYYWRAYPANGGSRAPVASIYPYGTLEVIPASGVALLSPAGEAEIAVTGDAGVPLSWTATRGASAYMLEISANADMRNPVVSRQIEGTRVTQTGLENGNWYWRIIPIYPNRVIGLHPPSTVNEFYLRRESTFVSYEELGYTAVEEPAAETPQEPQTVEIASQPEPGTSQQQQSRQPVQPRQPSAQQPPQVAEQTSQSEPEPQPEPEPEPPPQAEEPANQAEYLASVFNRGRWESSVTFTTSEIGGVTINYYVAGEVIDGQRRNIITIETDLARGVVNRTVQITNKNADVIQRLRNGTGVRFKVATNGGQGWNLCVTTSEGAANSVMYEANIATRNAQTVTIDIPFSRLRQSTTAGTGRVAFNKNNINGLLFQRSSEGAIQSGTSTVKIYDFEVY